MENNQTLTTSYRFRAEKIGKKTGTVVLDCRLVIDGVKGDMSTGILLHPDQWNTETNSLNPNCENYAELKARLDKFDKTIHAHFIVLQASHDHINDVMLKNSYRGLSVHHNPKHGKQQEQTILRAFDAFIEEFETRVTAATERKKKIEAGELDEATEAQRRSRTKKKGDSKETLKQWKATRNKVIEYLCYLKTGYIPLVDKKYQKTEAEKAAYIKAGKEYDLPLSSFEPAFAEDFETYLMEIRSELLGDGATNKQLKNTKQIFTYSIKKGWLKGPNPLEDYITSDDIKEIPPLEYHEVEALYNAKGLTKPIERVCDSYIAQIFSGFAWQDVRALGPDNIFWDEISGKYFLRQHRGKTKVEEMVEILPPIEALIEKYKDDPYCIKRNVLFPIIANNNYNAYLKVLADVVGIDRKLNTHLARHTFAHLMLNRGVRLEVVSRMLGHKSIRTTQRYCRVTLELIHNSLKPAIKKLFTKNGTLIVVQRKPQPGRAPVKKAA